MWKEAFLKALTPITFLVFALVVGLAPLYLLAGLMTRPFSTTTPQTEYRPVKH